MQDIIRALYQAQRIVLISHIRPDGDAIGSLLGLHEALLQMGKEVTSVQADGVPAIFHFLPQADSFIQSSFPDPSQQDLAIVLDNSDLSRTGYTQELTQLAQRQALAIIDHHPRGDVAKLASAGRQQTTAAATTELIYGVIRDLSLKITPTLATNLLIGLYTDTGGFQYSNTNRDTLGLTAELMRRGGNLHLIVQRVAHNKSVASLKLLGRALERVSLTIKGRCAVSVLTTKDIQEAQAQRDDLTGIANQLVSLTGPWFSLLLTEYEPGVIRGTLRTNDGHRFDVSRLAAICGGGGHPRAAGFVLPGHLQSKHGRWQIENA